MADKKPLSAFGKIGDYYNANRILMSDQPNRSAYMAGKPMPNSVSAIKYKNEQPLVDKINAMPNDVIPVRKSSYTATDVKGNPLPDINQMAPLVRGGAVPVQTNTTPVQSAIAGQYQQPSYITPSNADALGYGAVPAMSPRYDTPKHKPVPTDSLFNTKYANTNPQELQAGYGSGYAQDSLQVQPQSDGLMSSIGNYFNGSMGTPNGMSKSQFDALPIETQAQLMSGKSGYEKLGSTLSGVGSMAGGLAGVYGAYANAKYMKDQANMQKAMIRGDEANKSAFAKAAGGTYQKSGV